MDQRTTNLIRAQALRMAITELDAIATALERATGARGSVAVGDAQLELSGRELPQLPRRRHVPKSYGTMASLNAEILGIVTRAGPEGVSAGDIARKLEKAVGIPTTQASGRISAWWAHGGKDLTVRTPELSRRGRDSFRYFLKTEPPQAEAQ